MHIIVSYFENVCSAVAYLRVYLAAFKNISCPTFHLINVVCSESYPISFIQTADTLILGSRMRLESYVLNSLPVLKQARHKLELCNDQERSRSIEIQDLIFQGCPAVPVVYLSFRLFFLLFSILVETILLLLGEREGRVSGFSGTLAGG